ncbi:MAG TPA: flagellar basal body-associated FliL family protein [Candidatus Aquilonibacter sp.]|nr:flagellar basal body-associated FliL family protein [Candidatus Aquilonibacter sp.]
MAKETKTDAQAPKKSKSGVSTFLGVAIAVVLVVGGGGAWYLHHNKVQASNEAEGNQPLSTIHLDSFIVNLADQEQITYLRASIDLGVDRPPAKNGEGGGAPTAAIRDTIIGVLATRHSAELLTPDGKNKLKQDLIAALNQRVPEIGVKDIYFTDFLVQR